MSLNFQALPKVTSLICYKRGCVFPMVIWSEFRMGKYRVNDHPYHAPQFIYLAKGIQLFGQDRISCR